jgi:hypothetical protein
MPFITESQVRNKVADVSPMFHKLFLAIDAATSVLRESFDIFLSHSTRDAEIILGLKRLLEETGKTVRRVCQRRQVQSCPCTCGRLCWPQ